MLNQKRFTIPSEMRDFPEWHRGREQYAVWLLACSDSQAIQKKFDAARTHLQHYLLTPYHRQPHITLFVCGFLVEASKYNDDCIQAQIDAQIGVLENEKLKSFEIEIGGMNSFASAPFLEISDLDHRIAQLRQILSKGAPEFRTAPYRPHLTIGLYAGAFSAKDVLTRMTTFSVKPVRWRVEAVTLATYQANQVAGALSPFYTVQLS